MVMAARAEVHFIIDQAIQNMQTLEARARATGTTLGTAFNTDQGSLERYNQALTTVGRNFTIAGGAITGFVGLAVNSAMNFEAAIDAVGAVSGANADKLALLSKEALRVGADTTFSATEVASAAEILAKAGITIENITGDYAKGVMGIAEGAVRLSEATGSNITLSAETAAAAMTVFNLTAADTEHVMNVIAQSANASMLGVDDWTAALQYAGPTAATLGYTIDELAQAMVILGNNGIRGSVAATSLRNIMSQLTDTGSPAVAMLTEYGVSLQDAEGNMRGLDDITRDLVPTWNNLTDAEKNNFAIQAFGVRGGPAFLAMMNEQAAAVNAGGDAWVTAGEKMEATGDIHSMSAARMDNLAGSIERLKGSIETLMINFGSRLTPAIRLAADAIGVFTDWLGELPSGLQTVIAFATAATGILLLLSGGFMLLLPQIFMTQMALTQLGGMGGVLRLLVGPIHAIGVAFMANLGPILLVVAAAALIYAAWKTNFLGIRDLIKDFGGWIKDTYNDIKDFVNGVLGLFGKAPKEAKVDVKTTKDEGFEQYLDADGQVQEAGVNVTTTPDDMFIENIVDSDGTVIGYEVKITSSTDGTEQTGKILSSSRDENDPDLIHMEVQLESGETVQGTYNEITGKFTAMTGDMNVSVGATFVGDAYYIKQETLPDGTKEWIIREKNGDGAFGKIIQSYIGLQGETWILIEGKDGPFWTTVDPLTGVIDDPAVIPITANPKEFYSTKQQLMATGETKTIVIDGDGNPVGTVIRDIITNPFTGTKKVLLRLDNGQTFIATVNSTTGAIISTREITLTADDKEIEDAKLSAGALWDILDAIAGMDGDGEVLDLIFAIVEGLELAVGHAKDLYNLLTSTSPPGSTATAGVYSSEKTESGTVVQPNYITARDKYQDRDLGAFEKENPGYVDVSDPYRPNEGGLQDLWDRQDAYLKMQLASERARETVDALSKSFSIGRKPVEAYDDSMLMMAGSAQMTDVAVFGAGRSIAGTGSLIGSTFEQMAASILGQSGIAATGGSTSFMNLQNAVTRESGLAYLNADTNVTGMAGALAERFSGMELDTSGKMGALAAAVTSRSSEAQAGSSISFLTLKNTAAEHFAGMQNDTSSRMGALQSTVTTEAQNAKANATAKFSEMTTGVAGHMLGMQVATQLKMALMAAQATTQGEALRSNLVTKMEAANTGSSNTLAKLSGIVMGAGANAAVSALIAGANIGNAFALGMESALGRIRSAAASMVAAASAAVIAKAMITSPSKVFMKLGGYMGEGVEVGILNSIDGVITASERLVNLPAFYSPRSVEYSGGYGGGTTVIDNSRVEYIALTESDFQRLLAKAEKGVAAANYLTQPDSFAQYGGGN